MSDIYREEKKKKSPIGFFVFVIVMMIIGLIAVFFGPRILQFAKDEMRIRSYEQTDEEYAIMENLELTKEGERLFKIAHLKIVGSEELKDMCDPDVKKESLTGGCYWNENIYVYNFDTDYTKLYKDYTAAHELLHVVYERMSSKERKEIDALVQEVFNDERYHEQLAEEVSNEAYDEYRANELHSRVGTELMELPEALEAHYGKYFTNREKIVGYYESVYNPIKEAEERILELEEKLTEMEVKVEEYNEKGTAWAEDYNNRVNEFNKCAYTPGCFVGNEFAQKRAKLANEQEELDAYLREWDTYFDEYSKVYDEYAELFNQYQGFFGELKTWKEESAPEN